MLLILKTTTGDILVSSNQNTAKSKANKSGKTDDAVNELICNLNVPPPVYFCTVEPKNESEEKLLKHALNCFQREDPSVRINIDNENSGQIILQCLGELQYEIIKDRLKKEFMVDAHFGALNISYKEIPTTAHEEKYILNKKIGDKKICVDLSLLICPLSQNNLCKSVELSEGSLKTK